MSDRKREVVGVSDPFELEERIANLLFGRVHPRIVPEIDILRWRERAVVAVTVHPGPSRPYRLCGTEGPKVVFVRVGSTNRQADDALVRDLARVAAGSSFDEEPLPDLGVADLDRGVISEAFGRGIGCGR